MMRYVENMIMIKLGDGVDLGTEKNPESSTTTKNRIINKVALYGKEQTYNMAPGLCSTELPVGLKF